MKVLSPLEENRLLARVTFATAMGDFISYFAVLMIVRDLTQSTVLAAYTVGIKTLGIALGGALFPRMASVFGFRSLLIWSQFLSGVLLLLLLGVSKFPFSGAAYVILGMLFVQTLLKQFFEAAREARSKILGEEIQDNSAQRGFQAQLLQGFYSAQILGPLISFIFIRNLDVQLPLILDAITFFVAAFLCRRVGHDFEERTYKIFRPLSYIWQRPELLSIFLIRSIGMWIPIGIFNFVLFAVLDEHYGVDLLNSAWVYIAIGFGSLVATTVLRRNEGWWSQKSDATIAAIGFACLALTRFGFISLPSFTIALVVLALGGLCNGANATVTQSLRRKICSAHELPEIMGLELFIGRLSDWLVSSCLLYFMGQKLLSYSEGIYLSIISLLILSFAMIVFRLKFQRL